MAKQKYRQLQPIERMRIEIWKSENVSAQEMGRRLGRSASTITREVKHNTCQTNDYQAHGAQWRHSCRRTAAKPKPKLHPDGVLWGVVCELLRWKWSPQEIAATLKRAYPQQSQHHVSHETIYTAIYAYPKGELRKELIACLRQNRTKRMPRSRGQDRRGRIAEMVSIHVRPPEVDDRIMPGHWEGDLIKGSGNKSAVAVLVERVSRAVMLAKMPDASAASALQAFTDKLQSLQEPLRQTLTYDHGREMSRHAELTEATGVRVYFCDPHSPWQRGTCENTNGLLRQYLPKGTDLSVYSQEELDAIADSLNTRPRQTLGWMTPLQILAQVLANPRQTAAVH